MTKKKKRGKAGRPSQYLGYSKDLPEKMVVFFDRPVFNADGKLNRLPTLVDFCRQEGVAYSAMRRWLAHENRAYFKDLQESRGECLALLERNLVEAGFTGKSNSIFTIFAAKNLLGWADKQDISMQSKTGWASIAKKYKE
jgi:hypothetical protein